MTKGAVFVDVGGEYVFALVVVRLHVELVFGRHVAFAALHIRVLAQELI